MFTSYKVGIIKAQVGIYVCLFVTIQKYHPFSIRVLIIRPSDQTL